MKPNGAKYLALFGLLLAGCASPEHGPAGGAKLDADSASLVHLAEVAQANNDNTGATSLYRKALVKYPDDIAILLGLAMVEFNISLVADSMAHYERVLQLQPASGEAHVGLGRIHLLLRKPHEAEVEFSTALTVDPRNVRYLNEEGIALDLCGRHAEAQAIYREGIVLAPDDRALRNNLGLSLALGGAYSAAVDQLSSLSLEPGATPRMRQNLALALGLRGDSEGAAHVLRADLAEDEVTNNLRYYNVVRRLDGQVEENGAGTRDKTLQTTLNRY